MSKTKNSGLNLIDVCETNTKVGRPSQCPQPHGRQGPPGPCHLPLSIPGSPSPGPRWSCSRVTPPRNGEGCLPPLLPLLGSAATPSVRLVCGRLGNVVLSIPSPRLLSWGRREERALAGSSSLCSTPGQECCVGLTKPSFLPC